MLLLPSLASCRFLSTGVHFENHVPVMSGDEGPHVELAPGMEPNNETRLLTYNPELIGKDFLKVLPVKHSRLDFSGGSAAA
jgi:hypothetical protein